MASLYSLVVICLLLISMQPDILQAQLRHHGYQNIERSRQVHPPPGYIYLPNSAYYKFHPQTLPWLLASYTCQEEGGHLVVFNSEAEAKFVSGLWDSPHEWAYIGFHDFFTEGVYVTIFNQTLEEAGYSKKFPGEPNGGVHENCGALHKNGLLANLFCHLPAPFICEINLDH